MPFGSDILANEYKVGRLPLRELGFEIGAHAAHDILDAAEAGNSEQAGGDGTAVATTANDS